MNREGYYTNNTPDLAATDVAQFAIAQNQNMDRFVMLAGIDYEPRPLLQVPLDGTSLSTQPSTRRSAQPLPRMPAFYLAPKNDDWRPVINAGMHYVDVRCQRFVDALFWLNRIRETSSREIGFIGSASAAALTILSASTQLIGLAPLAFGLANQTVNNIGQGLLYELPPTAVRTIVTEQQAAYVQAMEGKTYNSRAVALSTIQGYAALCLPATIESEVNRAIVSQRFHPAGQAPADEAKPAPPPPPPPADAPAQSAPQIEPDSSQH